MLRNTTEMLGSIGLAQKTLRWFCRSITLNIPESFSCHSILPFVFPATFFIPIQFVSIRVQSVDAKIEHSSINWVNLCLFSSCKLNLEMLFKSFSLHYSDLLNTKWILHQNIINEKIACSDTRSHFNLKIIHQAWFTLLQTYAVLLSI